MKSFFKVLFDAIGVKYTSAEITDIVKSNAYSNSMYGVSSILSAYNIDNSCLRLENKDDIRELSTGIIIYRGAFAVINDITPNSCVLTFSDGSKQVALDELYQGWNGVVMTIDKRADSGEPNYKMHKKEEVASTIKSVCLGLVCLVGLIIGVALNIHKYNAVICSIIAVNAIGIGISFLLLQKQLHIPNKFADKLCGLAKESHCEDVTQSDGATLLGLFKLSEIGAAFFTVNFLMLIFAPGWAGELAVYAAIVLPFSFWSVWYQKFRAKSWCVLCLITLALMWIQTGLYLLDRYYAPISFSVAPATLIAAFYCAFALLVNRIMILVEKARKDSVWKREFNFLKDQEFVIDAYMAKSAHFDTSTDGCSLLVFGDEDAPRTITVFSNPYCSPCASMHEKIADYPGQNVRVQYIMTFFSPDRSTINKYIIAAYQQLGAERTWDLLTQWYAHGKQQGTNFFAPFNLDITTPEVNTEFEKHKAWSNNDKLYGTPTVLVGGVAIDYPYEVSDYMLFPDEKRIQST